MKASDLNEVWVWLDRWVMVWFLSFIKTHYNNTSVIIILLYLISSYCFEGINYAQYFIIIIHQNVCYQIFSTILLFLICFILFLYSPLQRLDISWLIIRDICIIVYIHSCQKESTRLIILLFVDVLIIFNNKLLVNNIFL